MLCQDKQQNCCSFPDITTPPDTDSILIQEVLFCYLIKTTVLYTGISRETAVNRNADAGNKAGCIVIEQE